MNKSVMLCIYFFISQGDFRVLLNILKTIYISGILSLLVIESLSPSPTLVPEKSNHF